MTFTRGVELIDRSPLLGDSQVRFESSRGPYLAVVYSHGLRRLVEVPIERLATEPTYPWGPKPRGELP